MLKKPHSLTELVKNTQLNKARKINVTRVKRIEIWHLLRIRNMMLHKCDIRLWVFVESETAPLETVPLTGELMQIEVLRGGRDFGTKDFVALKDNGLALTT